MKNKKKYVFKILIAGEGGSGKTTFIKRVITNKFIQDTEMTIGVEFHLHSFDLPNPYNRDEIFNITLQLWDFGGQERFHFMLPTYVTGAKASIILYDRTRSSSLFNMKSFVDIVRTDDKNIPLMLIGSKSDKVDSLIGGLDSMASDMMGEYNIFDKANISSKSGEGINDIFNKVALKILTDKGIIGKTEESATSRCSISQIA